MNEENSESEAGIQGYLKATVSRAQLLKVAGAGTHRGEFMGIPATGKSIRVPAIIISRFENDLWREDHVCWDQFGMLQQLGVISMP